MYVLALISTESIDNYFLSIIESIALPETLKFIFFSKIAL